MLYYVSWDHGCFRTKNRRDAVRVGLYWMKSGREVKAYLVADGLPALKMEHDLPFGNSATWTERKRKEIAERLKGGA